MALPKSLPSVGGPVIIIDRSVHVLYTTDIRIPDRSLRVGWTDVRASRAILRWHAITGNFSSTSKPKNWLTNKRDPISSSLVSDAIFFSR